MKKLLILIAVTTILSCQEDVIIETSTDIVGKRLENPYTVSNMKMALENLKGTNTNFRTSENLEIETSHLYVKFFPKNEEEMDLLANDSTLNLYDYPLDYEIAEGEEYIDPEAVEDEPSPQYCSVNVGYEFPAVTYQILENLFIPEEASEMLVMPIDDCQMMSLVNEAMRITNNLEEIITEFPNDGCGGGGGGSGGGGSGGGSVGCSYCPQGTMRVWDDVVDAYVPIVGLKVRARRWFTTKTGITDHTGKYIIRHNFRRKKNYSLKWKRYQFSIRTGTFGQAKYNGPKRSGWWSKDFGASGSNTVNDKQQYYALIFQAAHDYYYGSRFGLASPPKNSTWKPQVKISASQTDRQHDKRSHAAPYARTLGIFPTVYIRTWSRRSDVVYAVTTHELAHMSHWDMDRDAFRSLATSAWVPAAPFLLLPDREKYAAVIESWANGVEWQFAQQRYRNRFGIENYEYGTGTTDGGNYQELEIAEDFIYTSIVVDIIDNENQRFSRNHNGNVAFPNDRVFGYTIKQVEQGLKGARSWNQWRDNMINRHNNNSSEEFINELFANWH